MTYNKEKSGFHLLSDNKDAFIARLALATSASSTLDIQYYIIHRDASGQSLAYAVLAAADRGVKVRVLIDDINLTGRDSRLKSFSQHENIEIRIFNPLSNREWFRQLELVVKLNHAGKRMHNKVFIADRATAILGGRNIGDEYFDARPNMDFVDLDLLTTGPIVDEISESFDTYWNSEWSVPIETISKVRVARSQLISLKRQLKDRWHNTRNTKYFGNLQESESGSMFIDNKTKFIHAQARLFFDCPEKISAPASAIKQHFAPKILLHMEKAHSQILITTPYFVPGDDVMKWFIDKRSQGVRIAILTNSLASTDVTAVHAGYRRYRRQLIDAGVDIFELKPSARHLWSKTDLFLRGSTRVSLHAKYIILDSDTVFVGSANIDQRSDRLNTEMGVMVNSEALAAQASALFHRTTSSENSFRVTRTEDRRLHWLTEENGETVDYRGEPHAGLLRRLMVFFIGLLPIENLL